MSAKLGRYRARLDALDARLVRVLAQRALLLEEVWAWKQAAGLPRRDPKREAAMRSRLLAAGVSLGLSRTALKRVLDAVIGVRLSSGPPRRRRQRRSD
jgi:chorismate mutase